MPENELPDQIWPVKFVNEAGEYEPGKFRGGRESQAPGAISAEAIADCSRLVYVACRSMRLLLAVGGTVRGER